VRLAALVKVEIATIAVHAFVGGAQMVGIGEGVLGLARETVRLGPQMLPVPEVRRVAALVTIGLGIERPV
jgi:hypothetical protein